MSIRSFFVCLSLLASAYVLSGCGSRRPADPKPLIKLAEFTAEAERRCKYEGGPDTVGMVEEVNNRGDHFLRLIVHCVNGEKALWTKTVASAN